MKFNLLILFFLVGCSTAPNNLVKNTLEENEKNSLPITQEKADHSVSYYDQPIIKNVNHYAKWLIQDLFANYDFPSNEEVFTVADFALLDSDLNKTNHFGRQVTEAILHEVNRTGFSVIDTRATGFIRISEGGDMFFETRDYRELAGNTNATNIISGTMTRHRGGYLLNARVVDINSLALLSTSQIFVPFEVVDSVMKEELPKTSIPETTGIALKPFSAQ